MYTPTPPPPVPPPKPSSHEASRLGTPATDTNSPRPPPPVPDNSGFHADGSIAAEGGKGKAPATEASGLILAPPTTGHGAQPQPPQPIPDPGEHWLPKILEDKSKQDLAEILGDPALLSALTYGTAAAHPSLAQTQDTLQAALQENVELAGHLSELEARLAHQRAAAQAQLLSTHALERQWRQKQSEMDDALAPFAPAALYGRLTRGLQEQEMMCQALEESFLDGGGAGATAGADDGAGSGNNGAGGDGGVATERETLEWVRRYREARKLFYLRQERKERWNERRVGGWR